MQYEPVICYSAEYGVCTFIACHEDNFEMCDIMDRDGHVQIVNIYDLEFDRSDSYITNLLLTDIRNCLCGIRDTLKNQNQRPDKPVQCWSCVGRSFFHRWVEKDGELLALVENSAGELHLIKPDSIRFHHSD